MSKVARGLIGPRIHDRVLGTELLQTIKRGVQAGDLRSVLPLRSLGPRSLRPTRSDPESTDTARHERTGPLAPDVLSHSRNREQAWFVATEKPLFPAPDERGALLIVVPWIIHGGVDRAIVDLVRGVRAVDPTRRCYLATSIPAINAWAEQLLPALDGVFSLHAFGSNDYSGALVTLARRLGVSTLLIANSRVGFDALPHLRRELPDVRVVVQAHNFEPDPVTKKPGGHVAYVASRYNNLVHGYTTISQKTADVLQRNFYVSPAKVKVVYLGVDTSRFAAARRERFKDGERIEVLWLGRLSEEKNPFLALEVAEQWRKRHGAGGVRFRIVGGGPLAGKVHEHWEREQLGELVELLPAAEDPVPLYCDADCLMLTSKYEGTPVVVFEALAAGVVPLTPVSNSSMGEYLTSRSAYVVEPPDDPSAFVTALEEMTADRATARVRAAAALAESSRFDVRRYVHETVDVLFPPAQQVPAIRAAS